MKLKGKIIVVTAAGQGIGKASVHALAEEGATVWATDVNASLLKDFDGIDNIKTAALDVLDKNAIDAFFSKLNTVDVLFNCAGVVHNGTVLDSTDAQWDEAFNLNARAQFWTIQAALPKMLARNKGSIINMASVASSVKGFPNRTIYGASKAAVIGLTKGIAADYVAQGIRCNAISPGTVNTPSLQERINSASDPVAAKQNFIARQPSGKLAEAHQIAPIVVFLSSDDAQFITGQNYAIDGGITI